MKGIQSNHSFRQPTSGKIGLNEPLNKSYAIMKVRARTLDLLL